MGRQFASERRFANSLQKRLVRDFPQYDISVGGNLLYKLSFDPSGEVVPSSAKDPRRGQYAFQTDLLVRMRRSKMPLVAVELKYPSFSTHDVLTYSTKALKHKEVYPFLRYGFVIGGKASIDRKFFIHNIGFDFALAMSTTKTAYPILVKILRKQIRAAFRLMKLMNRKRVISSYESRVFLNRKEITEDA